MQPNDSKEFSSMMDTVCEMYNRNTLSEFALTLWFNSLKNYTLEEVKHGLSLHLNNPDNGQFMPKPADVVKSVKGTTADNAGVAWSKVDKAVRSVGCYEDIVFDDPIIHVVITDMGGWIRLCTDYDDKAWPFVANDFKTRYRGYSVKQQVPEYKRKLTGITNAENSIDGHEQNDPILIGDSSVALKVFNLGSDTVKTHKTLSDARLENTEIKQIGEAK